MQPSSSRVKLNRVALKDVIGIKLVPRRSRKQEEKQQVCEAESVKDPASGQSSDEPVQSGPVGSEAESGNVPEGEPEHTGVGTQEAEGRAGCRPCEGAVVRRLNRRGPAPEASRANRAAGGAGWTLRKLCDLRPRPTWCFCPASDWAAPRRVKQTGKTSKMSRPVQTGRETLATSTTAKSQTLPDIKCGVGKSRLGGIKRRSGVSHAAKGGGGRAGQSTGRAGPPGWDPPPHSPQVRPGTRPIPAGLSNIDGNTHPSPAGLAGSEVALRRTVRASSCGLCADCSPQQRTLGKQGQKSFAPGPEQPTVEAKIKKETEASRETIVLIDQYPKVMLCDIAKTCEAFSCDCVFVLPDVLKTKVVCFKQDMRAGFWFRPGYLGNNNHGTEESALAKTRKFEKRACQSQTATEHRRHLKEPAAEQTLSSQTTCCFPKGSTNEGSPGVSASFLPDKRRKMGECRTGTLDRDAEEDPGSGIKLIGADQRIKLGDSCKNGISPPSEMDNPSKTDAAPLSPELLCGRTEVDTDEQESFTCQRVRVYLGKNCFSCARTDVPWPFSSKGCAVPAHADAPASPTEAVGPSTGDNCGTLNENQPRSSSYGANGMLPNRQVSHRSEEKREEGGERTFAERNGERHDGTSSNWSDGKNMEFAPHLTEAPQSLASFTSDASTLSHPIGHEREPATDPSSPVDGLEADSAVSTPSPSALGLSDWETATTLSPMSSSLTNDGLSSHSATPSSPLPSSLLTKTAAAASSPKCVAEAAKKTLFDSEDGTQMSSCSLVSSAPPQNSNSFLSCESSFLLPQESDEEPLGCPPKLEPYYNSSPINYEVVVLKARSPPNVLTENGVEATSNEFMLPPILSPITSPQGHSWTSCSEEEEVNGDISKEEMLPGCHMPQIVSGNNESSKDCREELEGVSTDFKTVTPLRELQSSCSDDEDVDETNYEDCVEQVGRKVPSDPKARATEPCSSPGSDEDDGGAFSDEGQSGSSKAEGSGLSETSVREWDDAEAAARTPQGILDEFTAYEQDVLLVSVIQEDPELFENLPQESLLKLGPTRVREAPKVVQTQSLKTGGVSQEQRLIPVKIDLSCDSPDVTESSSRSWRPQCSGTAPKKESSTCPAPARQTKRMGQLDVNNNHVNRGLERNQPIQTVSSSLNHIPPIMTVKNGPRTTSPANMAESRRQKSNAYCRQYFSEAPSCGFKTCWFQHVPVEGDEKFCIETVTRFTKIPVCLQKAGAVFTGYYQNNPPGVYFSMPVLLSLLWALLKAGMMSDVFSVLSASLAHKIVPDHEFLLALLNVVREKGLVGFAPELMKLMSKMASAGLVLSLDCLDGVKHTPDFQPNSLQVSGSHKIPSTAPFPEYLNLAHAIVEIELCSKQEDWKRMGEVFKSICQFSQHPNQVERISGHMAIALLCERKDKLALPFAAFAETVCQNEGSDSLARSFLGRIGVSLMLRYHKTHQWVKGRRVVEVLSVSKVNYSTLKGLFGNEDGASRCYLITVATELFLRSSCVEGALNTLRENNWFLSSSPWPCEAGDLESRTRVLIRLAEKTSHRDTLDVLCHLPGLKEPNNLVDTSKYIPLFNSHLQVCVDRHTLPVASDTADFMLSKNLAVDQALLQTLLHKLGKQNLWLRAREVFRHSLSVGYYPGVSAPPGFMTLIVPCRLGEVELALTFEMFITVNATVILHLTETTTSSLSITLKRTQSCESEYLSAGSRLLSAACIPQPKLTVHYTAVSSSSQEQVFTLDISSARCWLRHNHMWANEVWVH